MATKPKTKHKLPEFEASISTQGGDRHLHIPRRMYRRMDNMGMMGKKMSWKIVATEIE